MTTIGTIEEQMRAQEALFDRRLPLAQWIILRLDGRSFSALTEKHFEKPFDWRFHDLMVHAAVTATTELEARFAFVGSDEISLILAPGRDAFDRRQEKLVSLSASIVTSAFALGAQIPAQFDCRIQTADSPKYVVQYLLWRLADIERNARSTLAYWTLRQTGYTPRAATRTLTNAGREQQEGILHEYGVDFAALPAWQRRGAALIWESYEKAGYNPIEQRGVTAQRRRLMAVEIPETGYASWLEQALKVEEA